MEDETEEEDVVQRSVYICRFPDHMVFLQHQQGVPYSLYTYSNVGKHGIIIEFTGPNNNRSQSATYRPDVAAREGRMLSSFLLFLLFVTPKVAILTHPLISGSLLVFNLKWVKRDLIVILIVILDSDL